MVKHWGVQIRIYHNSTLGGAYMYIKTRITIRNEEKPAGHGFGRGIELLLTGIEQYGSLNRDRKSTRLNSSHPTTSRMPSSA